MPGDLLLSPLGLLSVAVLALNDHWLKARLGTDPRLGVVTGKLSDVAGLVFFPLVLVSMAELARWLVRASGDGGAWIATRRQLAGAAVVTGLGFAAIQVVPVAACGYVGVLAALRWLPAGLMAVLTAAPVPPWPRIHHVMDVTDCLCLPALCVGYWDGARSRPSPGWRRQGQPRPKRQPQPSEPPTPTAMARRGQP